MLLGPLMNFVLFFLIFQIFFVNLVHCKYTHDKIHIIYINFKIFDLLLFENKNSPFPICFSNFKTFFLRLNVHNEGNATCCVIDIRQS